MTRQESIKRLLHNHTRRLQLLKEQKALAGWSVDPSIPIEIEDIEAEIRDLQIELSVIESRLSSTAARTSPAGLSPSTTPPCILVVDDEPDFLRNLCLALEMAGYGVVAARDGAEALAMLQLHSIDLILADVSMPYMSGYQLYSRICENPRWITLPFIFLSARALDSDIYYGKELGVDDYLTKPIGTEQLLSVIRGKLRRRLTAEQLRTLALSN